MAFDAVYPLAQEIFSVEDSNTFIHLEGDRYLPLKIYSPLGDGPFPVIIFSHGAGARSNDYAALGKFWASCGYISIHPTHMDSVDLLKEKILDGNGFRSLVAGILRDPDAWLLRVEEIKQVINNLPVLAGQIPHLHHQIDGQKLAIAGHSLGAYTAQLMGGATITLPGTQESRSLADSRVKALLLLSPQGMNQQGLTRNSWDNMRLPMMVMTGSRDRGAKGQGPEWKSQPFTFSPPGDKYLVLIQDAHHFSFSGRLVAGNSPSGQFLGDQTTVFAHVKLSSLLFYEAYLKLNPDAKNLLMEGQLGTETSGQVRIAAK